MNDLISRSIAVDLLYKYADQKFVTDGVFMANGILKAKCFIESEENIPTAFDVDKVIAELEKLSIEELGVSESQFEMDKGEYLSYCTLCLYDVVELLKKHLTGTAEPPKTD